MTRRAVACWAIVACSVVACGVPEERRAHTRADDDVPFGLLDEGAPPLLPTDPGPVVAGEPLCFIEGDGLAVVTAAVRTNRDLLSVVRALAEPPPASGRDLRTAIDEDGLVRDVRLAAGVAQVDLLPDITALSGDEQLLAVAQLVCTLTGQPGVGPVSFTLEGASVDVPRGDGSLTSDPVSRDDYLELLDRGGA